MLLALLALISCLVRAHASGRLREVPSVSARPGGPDLPVDPKGEHGPVRTAGYFKLNRTVVRSRPTRSSRLLRFCVRVNRSRTDTSSRNET
jgi:hypothetical protein